MTDDIQVLEFGLGSERYCVDIRFVVEVVRRREGGVTPVTNAPSHVEEVMDLRGRTTEIVDTAKLLGTQSEVDGDGRDVIVFEQTIGDGGNVGWSVDGVDRISRISLGEVEEMVDDQYVNGIVNRTDGFLFWTSPDAVAG